MKTLIPAAIRRSLMFTAVAALSLAYPASVQAVRTTYRYTGNPFTNVGGFGYTTSDFVTAMVTLANPLPPNAPLTQVTPLAFSLSDGVQTITNLNATAFTFQFATDGDGTINQWGVDVFLFSTIGGEILTRTIPPNVADAGALLDGISFGFNNDDPGAWAGGAVPDAASTLSLLSLSLTALGVVARRFQRAAG